MAESPETKLDQVAKGLLTTLNMTALTPEQKALLTAILKVAWNISHEEELPADVQVFSDAFASSFTPAHTETIVAAASARVFRSNLISQDSSMPGMVSHLLISRSVTDEPPDDPTANLISR